MLCRTANQLYWMARHIERAENTARMLDVTYRTSLLPYEVREPGLAWADPWSVPLVTLGPGHGLLRALSRAHGGERAALHGPRPGEPVVDLLLPARGARVGARGARRDHLGDVRGPELDLARDARATTTSASRRSGVSEFLDWVKMRSHLFRGVTFGTMLRDEAYHFIRLGTHLERADNTARILDVKYHILLPSVDGRRRRGRLLPVGVAAAVGVRLRVYRKIYSDVITPRRVAELLILRDDMPRSLHSCMNFIHETLEMLCDDAQSRAGARRRASCTRGCITRRTDDIIEFGLHEYLMDFLERISELGGRSQPRFPGAHYEPSAGVQQRRARSARIRYGTNRVVSSRSALHRIP